MKRLVLFVIILLCAHAGSAKADILKDILGSWKFSAEFFRNGKKIGYSTGTARISRHGQRGLYIVQRESGHTSYTWLKDSGEYRVKNGSQVFLGKWKVVGDKLVVDAKKKPHKGKITAVMNHNKKIIYTSIISNGKETYRTVGIYTRK